MLVESFVKDDACELQAAIMERIGRAHEMAAGMEDIRYVDSHGNTLPVHFVDLLKS